MHTIYIYKDISITVTVGGCLFNVPGDGRASINVRGPFKPILVPSTLYFYFSTLEKPRPVNFQDFTLYLLHSRSAKNFPKSRRFIFRVIFNFHKFFLDCDNLFIERNTSIRNFRFFFYSYYFSHKFIECRKIKVLWVGAFYRLLGVTTEASFRKYYRQNSDCTCRFKSFLFLFWFESSFFIFILIFFISLLYRSSPRTLEPRIILWRR